MNDIVDIPCVSIVEPLFTGDPPSCTRTWYIDADPQLNEGAIVKVGGMICNVTGKKSHERVVTYQFSPVRSE